MYNRLFTKILDSSIWLEPTATRIVWITLLATMDKNGYAHFSAIENLAGRARIPIKETLEAVAILSSPDPNSANPDNEGRRIERVPGGFIILNAEIHRGTMNKEIEREQTRVRVAAHREKLKCNKPPVTRALPSVTSASASVVTSEGIGDARGKGEPGVPLTPLEVRFNEWMKFRKSLGKKPGNWEMMFDEQRVWLKQFPASTQLEILSQSIRNGWQGLFPFKSESTTAPPWQSAADRKQTEIDEANRLYREKKRRERAP